MAKPFDIVTKHLVEAHPKDWLALAGLPAARAVKVIDADLSTLTAEADKVLAVGKPATELVHLELQTHYDARLGQRSLQYSVLLSTHHRLPVRSVIVLLRPKADGPKMTGEVRHHFADGTCYLEFRHQIIRLWQLPVERLLAGGLGTLPLAPLSQVSREALPRVIRRMKKRLHGTREADELWAAIYVLMGLQYHEAFTQQLLQGVRAMKDSVTYQAILREGRAEGKAEGKAEGRAEGARAILLRLGSKQLGRPDKRIRAALEAIGDVERLEQLSERLLEVESWNELLAVAD